jgi:HD superfamily phosphohydrolase
MHLACMAIETLRGKGHEITPAEEEGLIIAILLHDVGHGPFSHALEHTIVEDVPHEYLSSLIMDRLNGEFGGRLGLAIRIFNKTYPKAFLNQLVSSQLDIDRLDYLNRDSFFTGVSEGVISFDRIIKMLEVRNGELVIEEKGIYSVEKFLIARRLMYWQVYLHKTVIAAEQLLVKILERAKYLSANGIRLFATPGFTHFLEQPVDRSAFTHDPVHLDRFVGLDDFDILASIKTWVNEDDPILSRLCRNLLSRQLYRVEISADPPPDHVVIDLAGRAMEEFNVDEDDSGYFVFTDTIRNDAYQAAGGEVGGINLLMKDGSLRDITTASDNANLEALSRTVEKYILCYDRRIDPDE